MTPFLTLYRHQISLFFMYILQKSASVRQLSIVDQFERDTTLHLLRNSWHFNIFSNPFEKSYKIYFLASPYLLDLFRHIWQNQIRT